MNGPPRKHLPHGNYRRADWFETRCKSLEAAITAALAEDHGDPEVYAELVPKILARALGLQ